MAFYEGDAGKFNANNSGIGLNEQPPWMKNTTPKAQLASVGFSLVEAHPNTQPNHVHIPNNWLKK